MTATIKNHGLTTSVVEKWSGNLELTVSGTPVIVGVEYADERLRVDFIRFIDSGDSVHGVDLVWEREDGWQGIPNAEQRAVSLAIVSLSSIDLDELTVEGGRPLFWEEN